MKFADYIPLAMRTCKELPLREHLAHMAMGITGEMGEIIDALKKHHIYGKPLDQANIVEEVGDVAYYVAGLVSLFPNLNSSEFQAAGFIPDKSETLMQVLRLNSGFARSAFVLCIFGEEDLRDIEHNAKSCLTNLHQLAVILEVDLEQALDINIAKLAKRYGDKYSDYSATNRDLDAERAILEGRA